MNANAIQAAKLGEVGYVNFLLQLKDLGVVSRRDVLVHLRLHGDLLRLTGEPLDDVALSALADELGGQVSALPPAVRAEGGAA